MSNLTDRDILKELMERMEILEKHVGVLQSKVIILECKNKSGEIT